MSLPARMHIMTTQLHAWDAVRENDHFFQVCRQVCRPLEHKPVGTEGFADREGAKRVMAEAFARAQP